MECRTRLPHRIFEWGLSEQVVSRREGVTSPKVSSSECFPKCITHWTKFTLWKLFSTDSNQIPVRNHSKKLTLRVTASVLLTHVPVG